MKILAIISLLAAFVSVPASQAATIVGPVEIAHWDAEGQDSSSKTSNVPFVAASMMQRTDGQAFPLTPGFQSDLGFEVDTLLPQERGPLLEFSVTNTHPIEVLEITGVEFASQQISGSGLVLGVSYQLDTPFALEINDAVGVAPFWRVHRDGLPDTPALQIIIGPNQTATFYIDQVQGGNFSPVQFDDIRLTGFTVVPEPSSAVLVSLCGLLLLHRRRKAAPDRSVS